MTQPTNTEAVAELLAVRDRYTMACPDKPHSAFAVITRAADLISAQAERIAALKGEVREWFASADAFRLEARAAEARATAAEAKLAEVGKVLEEARSGLVAYTGVATAETVQRIDAALSSISESKGRSGDQGSVADDRRDAELWRALMRCGRIKMQGSSGVDPLTGKRNGNNVHFGAEFWPERHDQFPHLIDGHDRSTAWGKACLRALAEAVLEHEAASPTPDAGKEGA